MHTKYTLPLWQHVAVMSIISQNVYVCSDISEMNEWILFMLGTVINHHGFMRIKYTLAGAVPTEGTFAYFIITVMNFCDISHMTTIKA